MSEYSDYVLFREPVDPHEELMRLAATGLILPNDGVWTVVASPEREAIVEARLPMVVMYDYSSEHGVEFRVYVRGRLVARLSASSDGGLRSKFAAHEWVDLKLLSSANATRLSDLMRTKTWTHASVRDEVAIALGCTLPSMLSGRDLAPLAEDLSMRFPEATHMVDGQVQQWGDDDVQSNPGATANSLSIALLERVAAATADVVAEAEIAAKPTKRTPKISTREGKALAAAVAAAPSVEHSAPIADTADVDLAGCATPRAWLDAKRKVDPARASAGVLAELERTVREGRFSEAGDSAVVVREGAAMLLGRCIAMQQGKAGAAWLQERADAARGNAERAAWAAAMSTLTTELKPKRKVR